MTYQHWLRQAAIQLAPRLSADDSPRREAEILLSHVTGKSRSFIFAFAETRLEAGQQQQLAHLLARRSQGEPIAYITGQREFWSLPLSVSPASLIPRPDSECLVEQALSHLPACPCQILDLGTGCGAIALALATERADCQIVALDNSPQAVALAQQNVRQLSLKNVQVLHSDWFSALEHSGRQFAVIVSNPPYIAADDAHLQQGDVRFEPRSALISAGQGLADLALLVDQSRRFLQPAGWLLVEHGWQQGSAVQQLFHQAGYQSVSGCYDYGGNERVSLGNWLS